MSTKRRSNKRYSFELKLDAVKRVLAGESVINVAKKLEVTDPQDDFHQQFLTRFTTCCKRV